VIPNEITMINVLNACSHSGLVDEAIKVFDSMKSNFNIIPSIIHYNCLVDVLGRSGQLDKAESVINEMNEKDIITWITLLGACRSHHDVEKAEHVFQTILGLGKQKNKEVASAYVLMCNIYAAANRMDDANKIREVMKKNGVKKIPGMVWVELDGKVNSFISHDKEHPQQKQIYVYLENLFKEIKMAGYKPDTSFATQDVSSEEEKIQQLCYHSEKIAISFAMMNTPPGTTIRFIKNLRVCGDCHSATKFISKLYKREFIVRDANRFHHFKDGKCSCDDYW